MKVLALIVLATIISSCNLSDKDRCSGQFSSPDLDACNRVYGSEGPAFFDLAQKLRQKQIDMVEGQNEAEIIDKESIQDKSKDDIKDSRK